MAAGATGALLVGLALIGIVGTTDRVAAIERNDSAPAPSDPVRNAVLPEETDVRSGPLVPQVGRIDHTGAPNAVNRRILGVLEGVRTSMRDTRYVHRARVDPRQGIYHWDCSAMAAWVLSRSAPGAHRYVGKTRPQARDYFRRLRQARPTDGAAPWQRIERLGDARAGDVLAWIRPPWFRSRSTGHVGFLAEPPRLHSTSPQRVWLIRLIDATSLPHDDDDRTLGIGGFGVGTLLLLADEADTPTAYGWFGLRSPGVIPTDFVVARATR